MSTFLVSASQSEPTTKVIPDTTIG
jgi:hypothetical protein